MTVTVPEVPVACFFVGVALIVIAIFGGGLEYKEFKISTLPAIPRALSGALGTILIILSVFFPTFLPDPIHGTALSSPPSNSPTQPHVYQPIRIHYAVERKGFAVKLHDYLQAKGFEVAAIEDDFSQISEGDREQPGTVRVVYRMAARGLEEGIVDAIMHGQFPDIARLVERPSNNASVDLQIQVW